MEDRSSRFTNPKKKDTIERQQAWQREKLCRERNWRESGEERRGRTRRETLLLFPFFFLAEQWTLFPPFFGTIGPLAGGGYGFHWLGSQRCSRRFPSRCSVTTIGIGKSIKFHGTTGEIRGLIFEGTSSNNWPKSKILGSKKIERKYNQKIRGCYLILAMLPWPSSGKHGDGGSLCLR